MTGRFARAPRRRFDEDAAILPLVNIVFLLLVFFMVAGQLRPPDGIEVEPPAARLDAAAAVQRTTVAVDAAGALALDGEPMAAAALFAAVAARGPERVVVRADRAAPARRVVAVGAGLRRVGVATIALVVVEP